MIAPHYDRWTDRYLAYCAAMGERDPDEMLARDRKRWPGGPMAGFILWLSDKWALWERERGGPVFHRHGLEGKTPEQHRDFDQWLVKK